MEKPPFPTKSVMIKAKLQKERETLAEKTEKGYKEKKAKQSIRDLKERQNEFPEPIPERVLDSAAGPANKTQLKNRMLDEMQKINEQKFGFQNHKDSVHGMELPKFSDEKDPVQWWSKNQKLNNSVSTVSQRKLF